MFKIFCRETYNQIKLLCKSWSVFEVDSRSRLCIISISVCSLLFDFRNIFLPFLSCCSRSPFVLAVGQFDFFLWYFNIFLFTRSEVIVVHFQSEKIFPNCDIIAPNFHRVVSLERSDNLQWRWNIDIFLLVCICAFLQLCMYTILKLYIRTCLRMQECGLPWSLWFSCFEFNLKNHNMWKVTVKSVIRCLGFEQQEQETQEI